MIQSEDALRWLLSDRGWWLWSGETKREAIRLLVTLAPKLDSSHLSKLQEALLLGPPRDMFRSEIEPDRLDRIVDGEIWLRLKKLEEARGQLSPEAQATLQRLSGRYPDWALAPDERDEFPFWMDTGWTDEKDRPEGFELAPDSQAALLPWLARNPISQPWDGWRERCRESFTEAVGALADLSETGQWPLERWNVALQVGSEDAVLVQSWPSLARAIRAAPDGFLLHISHGLGSWLQAQSKVFSQEPELFLTLSRRLLELDYEEEAEVEDWLISAINSPIGHVSQALLSWWYRQEPQASEGFDTELKSLFTDLCNTGVNKYRHGRVLLSAHTVALFRVDEEWSRVHLLPLLDWELSQVEARAAWAGFLWSPRLYRPLLEAIKRPFLETARQYEPLGEQAEQYAAFLTFAALEPGDTFTARELAEATAVLPIEGLQSAAQALTRSLEGAGDQRGEYWQNRVRPYLRSVWPKSRELVTPKLSADLGRLCIAARDDFPETLTALKHWLQPVEFPGHLVNSFYQANLCTQFPQESLEFLSAVIGDNTRWLPRDLSLCLEDIGTAEESLKGDPSFIRLSDLIERRSVY